VTNKRTVTTINYLLCHCPPRNDVGDTKTCRTGWLRVNSVDDNNVSIAAIKNDSLLSSCNRMRRDFSFDVGRRRKRVDDPSLRMRGSRCAHGGKAKNESNGVDSYECVGRVQTPARRVIFCYIVDLSCHGQ